MGMATVHVLFIFLFIVNISLTTSISDSEALLKLKESFVNATLLDSWEPGTEPCDRIRHWDGVICENGVVSGLRLGHLGLSGKIDVDALVLMSGLRSISFMSNGFSGPIPDFHRLGALRGLYITDNQFSGEIPSDYFLKMEGLRKVWLSGNNFSGPVPSSVLHLRSLMELHLENNRFSGVIPPLEQPSLISVDLSHNNFEGEIPSSLLKFSVNAFMGNPGLCGDNIGKLCNANQSVKSSPRSNRSDSAIRIAIWVLVACFIALILIILVICVMRRRERVKEELYDPLSLSSSSVGKKDFESISQKGTASGRRTGSSRKGSRHGKGVGDLVIINDKSGEFGLIDLMKAAAEVLGNGGLGSSYKATMANGVTVVVKRIRETTKIGKDLFDAEVRKLGNFKQKNVLTPIAYHYRKDEKLLVYEYQEKGSLRVVLHGDRGIPRTALSWPMRLKIIQGIAKGLEYLHVELSSLDLPHGNLKSSNVLLTPNYEPLLVDYGFCSLISSSQAAQSLTGYKSPEAILDHNISPKCDVYCLGIIILEVVTGKFPSQFLNIGKGGIDLVQWVRMAIVEGRETELFDPDIASSVNSLSEVEEMLHIGAACTENNPDKRLDIREVIRRVEGICVGESYQDKKKFDLVPSLRDGYADQITAEPQPSGLEHRGNHSGRRVEIVEDQTGRNSFAFDVS